MTIQSIFTNQGSMNTFMGDDNRKYALYILQDSLYIEELITFQQEPLKYNAPGKVGADCPLSAEKN